MRLLASIGFLSVVKMGAKLDTSAAEAQRAFDLLQERRSVMISATVTGQIDVRQLAKRRAT